MGKKSKKKGYRVENEIVNLHKELGVQAARVPLSGSAGGEFAGDLRIADMTAEVKSRANGEGFKTLERWIEGRDLLFLRRDRTSPLVVLPWGTYERLISALARSGDETDSGH